MSNPSSNLGEVVAHRRNHGPPSGTKRGAWTTEDGGDADGRDVEAYGMDSASYVGDSDSLREHRGGCWHCFTRAVLGLWSTRQMQKENTDQEWYIRTTIRELIVYIIFISILCVLTFGMMSPVMYYHTKVLSELFLDSSFDGDTTVRTASQMADFWKFAESVMVDSLYWEQWYNNESTALDDRNILYENRLLGSPRLRQLRVRNDSCNVHDDFKRAITQCYDVYSPHIEDTTPFGPMNSSAWFYHSEKKMNGTTHWGILASYSGAGSYMDLGTTKASALAKVKELKNNLWISRGTRAVFLDFTVYNANINLFCVVKIVFEFPATGGMLTSWTFRTAKFLRYVSTSDYIIMGCEGVFVLFIIYYMIEEFLEIRKNGLSYFKSVWNHLDILVILLSLLCIAFSVYRTAMVDNLLENLLNKPEEFPDFDFLGFSQSQFNNAVAMAIFFAWIKIFKYVSFNKTMTQLSSTLSRCSKDIMGFAIMFFIVFFAFAQLGYLLFGTQVKDYSSFGNAVFTLLRLILGDFDFHELEAANRVLGPIFFLSYIFFVFFVLMNMFLAIINDTYAEVKSEIADQQNEFEIMEFFKRGANNLLSKLGKRDQLVGLQNAIKSADLDGDKKLSYEEVRRRLKAQNYSDMEIEMLFAKYDVDSNRELDENETRQMLADLEGQKLQLDLEIENEGQKSLMASTEHASRPASAAAANATGGQGGGAVPNIQGVSLEDFNLLSRRVDRMEHSIGSIVSKIDAVLVKMEQMERAKSKRRENMNKILDSISESEGMDEKAKRQQMEQLVREELQRWDSDASMRSPRTPQSDRMNP